MKALLILLALLSTQAIATSTFTEAELSEFETHNFKMPVTTEKKREARPNRENPMVHEFRAGRTARTVKNIVLTRTTRPNRTINQEARITLAQLF